MSREPKMITRTFEKYTPISNSYDEMCLSSKASIPELTKVINYFKHLSLTEYNQLYSQAVTIFKKTGVTFGAGPEKNKQLFPFDILPRVILSRDWDRIERGLKQRVKALNAFLMDIYHDKKIIKNKIIPKELIYTSNQYHEALQNVTPPGGVYIHIAGIDIVRDANGEFKVLEDNLRTPSGVSYALTNRMVMQHILPDLMDQLSIRSIEEYPLKLSNMLESLLQSDHDGISVLLTPGPYNSAYYEHTYLAKCMDWPLVQGQDLYVHNNTVYLKNSEGDKRVRVIYRRIDDDYLDPEEFRRDSLLGVPGMMRAYRSGNVVIANGVGNGIADDKAIFKYVPNMIRFYLDEEPILNQIETYICSDKKQMNFVLENIKKMVVKMVNSSGGYGMLIGPQANDKKIERFKDMIKANPRDYIAQPLIELSNYPSWDGSKLSPRRIDLRPFVISGSSSWVMPGALTRSACEENSYIVNSSQGGGSKDTWIIDDTA